MNCPRCKHGARRLDDGYICGSCYAGFLEKGTSASGEKLVVSAERPACFVARRRVDLGVPDLLRFAVLIAIGGLTLRVASEARWLGIFFLTAVVLPVPAAIIDRFSRVILTAADDGLTIQETIVRRHPVRIARETIDGFWVRCERDGDRLTGRYQLMIDQDGVRSLLLIGRVKRMKPLVRLSDDLAACVGVPSDTRGDDFA